MWLFEGLLMVIKVIRGWIIKISLLERPSVVTWQYHWESSPLSRLYDPSSHDQHYHPHPQMLSFLVVYWKANPCLFSCFCTCPCSSSFIIFVLLFTSSPLPNLYNFGSISPLPPSLPPPQWLAIIWMSHSIWNWDTWMNIIGYFPINPFQFKTPNSGSPPASVFMGMASTVLLTSDPCWRHVMGACLGHRVDI